MSKESTQEKDFKTVSKMFTSHFSTLSNGVANSNMEVSVKKEFNQIMAEFANAIVNGDQERLKTVQAKFEKFKPKMVDAK